MEVKLTYCNRGRFSHPVMLQEHVHESFQCRVVSVETNIFLYPQQFIIFILPMTFDFCQLQLPSVPSAMFSQVNQYTKSLAKNI